MQYAQVDEWSRGTSFLHCLDPRGKLVGLVLFLVALATTSIDSWPVFVGRMAAYGLVLACGALSARLPLSGLAGRAAAVLPFSLTFALISWASGEPARAVLLVSKSYLSALAALLIVSTTAMPSLLRGMESLGAPRIFVLIVQFLHRYLFVISDQAHHMRLAAACRQAEAKVRTAARFKAAAGAVSVLFARSYGHAEGINQAMLSRGFDGRFPSLIRSRFTPRDLVFSAALACVLAAIRFAPNSL